MSFNREGEEHLPTAGSVNKKNCIQANVLHIFISNLSFLIKGLLVEAPKFTDGKISIPFIKNNLPKTKSNLPEVFRNDLIFLITSSSDHITKQTYVMSD